MADYNEKILTGKSWRRAYRIIIDNPLDQVQEVTYHREDIFRDSEGKDTHQLVDFVTHKFTDSNEMIPMIDMETGEVTETQHPVGLAAWILYSLFWKLSAEKDNPVIEADPPAPV